MLASKKENIVKDKHCSLFCGAKTHITTTFMKMTLSITIKGLGTLYCNAECHYAEHNFMQSVTNKPIIPSVVNLNVVMLNVVDLNLWPVV